MLADKITKLLADSGKSKTSFAEALGVTRATLERYLTGAVYMSEDKIRLTAKFFNVSIAYLFDESQQKTSISELKKIITEQNKLLNNIAKTLQINK